MTDSSSNTSASPLSGSAPLAQDTVAGAQSGKRRLALVVLALGVLLAAIAVGVWYLVAGRWQEQTDDAYVQGNIVQVQAQIPGTIVQVRAEDGDMVKAGDVLVTLDAIDAEVALAEAKANLANAVRQSHGLYNQAVSANSEVTARRRSFEIAQSAYQRRAALAKTGAVSAEELDQARQAFEAAQAAYSAAREQYDARRVMVAGTSLAGQPAVELAAARLRAAYVNSQRTAIVSPISGYVAKRAAQVGQRAQPGQPLMAVIPLQNVWIDANFKETQLRKLRIGQPVTIHSDVYGSAVSYSGKIDSLGTGTGSVFSLLPAQNATGNWIKIVQRVPVRVAFNQPEQLAQHPLRLGMSTTVKVDIHQQDGPLLVQQPRTQPLQQTDVYKRQLQQADALVQQVIEANRPGKN